MLNRRQLLGVGAGLISTGAWAKTTNMGLPEAAIMGTAATQSPVRPSGGPDYNPVVTLNGWTLPYRMNGNVKEFHLVAEPVERELAEGTIAYLWGITASQQARRSKRSKVTGCGFLSPTSCRNTPRFTGTA